MLEQIHIPYTKVSQGWREAGYREWQEVVLEMSFTRGVVFSTSAPFCLECLSLLSVASQLLT